MNNANIKGFSKAAIEKLENSTWKGNVRELENAIERAVVLATSEFITPDDLPNYDAEKKEIKNEDAIKAFFAVDEAMTLDEVSKRYIEFIFKKNNFAKEQTAKVLNIDRKTLYRKLKEIEAPSHMLN